MIYSKPELLPAEAALEAIRGVKPMAYILDNDGIVYSNVSAYEIDE
jgi:hypothetical protein